MVEPVKTIKTTRQKIDILQSQLDQRANSFEKDVSSNNALVKAKIKSFKKEFRYDTKELGIELKDIIKNNVKQPH